MTDQELAQWLEDRLGPDNTFNHQFARDLIDAAMEKAEVIIVDWQEWVGSSTFAPASHTMALIDHVSQGRHGQLVFIPKEMEDMGERNNRLLSAKN